jgi:hypothetical protein
MNTPTKTTIGIPCLAVITMALSKATSTMVSSRVSSSSYLPVPWRYLLFIGGGELKNGRLLMRAPLKLEQEQEQNHTTIKLEAMVMEDCSRKLETRTSRDGPSGGLVISVT